MMIENARHRGRPAMAMQVDRIDQKLELPRAATAGGSGPYPDMYLAIRQIDLPVERQLQRRSLRAERWRCAISAKDCS